MGMVVDERDTVLFAADRSGLVPSVSELAGQVPVDFFDDEGLGSWYSDSMMRASGVMYSNDSPSSYGSALRHQYS
ncbi:hypothetical protein VMT65_35145 [Nocardia sp. CDC153]|uniref:hypothetical protein n=1 Tax=Nocardia sp. CDC153 TaxID=3112167 RepID=UPI002DBD4303|nr:hypothetical protein [Nocardia sp. CDC153]MEC3958314.1 hypothetical protein [Nocardia sp. CDC153]